MAQDEKYTVINNKASLVNKRRLQREYEEYVKRIQGLKNESEELVAAVKTFFSTNQSIDTANNQPNQ